MLLVGKMCNGITGLVLWRGVWILIRQFDGDFVRKPDWYTFK